MSERLRPLLGVLGCVVLVAGVLLLAVLAAGLSAGQVGLQAVVVGATIGVALLTAAIALMKAGSGLDWTAWRDPLRASSALTTGTTRFPERRIDKASPVGDHRALEPQIDAVGRRRSIEPSSPVELRDGPATWWDVVRRVFGSVKGLEDEEALAAGRGGTAKLTGLFGQSWRDVRYWRHSFTHTTVVPAGTRRSWPRVIFASIVTVLVIPVTWACLVALIALWWVVLLGKYPE